MAAAANSARVKPRPSRRRTAMIERMWAAIEVELGAVERMRAELGDTPQSPNDAERTARALESLTRTLKEIDRLRSGDTAQGADDDDDLPRDLDELRRQLARRIHAFVDSRTGGGVAGTSEPGAAQTS